MVIHKLYVYFFMSSAMVAERLQHGQTAPGLDTTLLAQLKQKWLWPHGTSAAETVESKHMMHC